MTHSFNADVAELIGLNEAIMLNSIKFWSDFEMANAPKDSFDVWVTNSPQAYKKIFPYMKEPSPFNVIDSLASKGLINSRVVDDSNGDKLIQCIITESGKNLLCGNKDVLTFLKMVIKGPIK